MTAARIAIVPVRRGMLPTGAAEAAAAAAGRVWLIGDGTAATVDQAAAIATAELWATEAPEFRPAALAAALAPRLAERHHIVLPGTADGRDLGPRLAHALHRPFLGYVLELHDDSAVVVHHGGRVEVEVAIDGPVVATVQPGTGAVPAPAPAAPPRLGSVELDLDPSLDAPVLARLAPDPATVDLADSTRIVGAGNGLDGPDAVALLGRVGEAIGAALGATRVVTDAGWLANERQIGTTGAQVDPDLYLAFGISGAVQHVMGLGDPHHVVAVNLDPSCPMMAIADLAIVADATAVVAQLAEQLGVGAASQAKPAPRPDPGAPR